MTEKTPNQNEPCNSKKKLDPEDSGSSNDEQIESKSIKTYKTVLHDSPKTENTIIGDDINNRNKHQEILCECHQPNVSGAAVPIVLPLSNDGPIQKINNKIAKKAMKKTASILSTTNEFKYQKTHIEKLIKNISEIQGITNNLIENEGKSENSRLDSGSTISSMNKVQLQIIKPKRESQVLATESLSKKTDKQLKQENLKTTDSMDGVFIPSCEPPINIEDDEEANDSEITSDIKNLLIHPVESSITLRLSDLSVEGIKTLKKCPKEFKFRMDIIQGKIVFQPGKQPISKFPLVPDFSYTEITLDEKASEMISIKPSTECIFTSQLIPVDNRNNESFSSKSINLRAVVSEIFTVVNMPLKNRNKSLNTVTKSCGTFTDEPLSVPNNEHVMSMPEMTGVANDLEEPNLKNLKVLDGDSSSKDNAAPYVT